MQVPLGNEKIFGKWPKAAAFIKYDHFYNRGYTLIFFFTEGSMFSRTARYMKNLAQFFASFLKILNSEQSYSDLIIKVSFCDQY